MTKNAKPLERSFYLNDAVTVARALLGKRLVHRSSAGETSGIIVETEAYTGRNDAACHSYLRHGPAENHRTNIMFSEGGFAYVYLIYGMYHCFNVVVNDAENPEAVLIRALQPTGGITLMEQRRNVGNALKRIKGVISTRERPTEAKKFQTNFLYSSRLEISEAEHGSHATQGGCARPKAAAPTGCGLLTLKKLCSGPGKLCIAMGITREHYGKDLCRNELYVTHGEIVLPDMILATPRINVDYAGEASLYPYRFVWKESPFLSTKKFVVTPNDCPSHKK
ncbi:MAG: DNA-3-methyladenine glycosylase [Planctomycetaceae bacterium]|nr:DNA-3-methyladenine glycosylase [Planctomycetaceae bacterium]